MAAQLNLLPWRQQRRKLREREFYAMLIAAVIVGLLIAAAGVFVYESRINAQQARNDHLRSEIAALEDKIREIERLESRRRQLIARKDVIERLQANRTQVVHLFDELVRTIPEGVRLSAIRQSGGLITLEGFAQSQQRVSMYMRRLDSSEWLTQPDLNIIEARSDDQTSRFSFTLRVRLTQPGATPQTEGEDPDFPALAQGGRP